MPKVFVAMPFGKRTAPENLGVSAIDFDDVYQRVIRPVVEGEGLRCLRIDEVPESGSIEQQFLREILESELMVADISLPNGNVYYELGLRNAMAPGASILIAHIGADVAFDLRTHRILFYELSAPGVDMARQALTVAVRTNLNRATQNPVRVYLEQVGIQSSPSSDPTRFRQDLQSRIQRATTIEQLLAVWNWAKRLRPLPVATLLELAAQLADRDGWAYSVEVLRRAVAEDPDDFEAQRQLGWHLSKLGPEHWNEAHEAFDRALELNPGDPETLGTKGGLFKRQQRYAEAADCYARGAQIAPTSLYMRVNAAALTVLQNPKEPEHGIRLYAQLLSDVEQNPVMRADAWSTMVLGEAAFATGDFVRARNHYGAGIRAATATALRSVTEQLRILGHAGFRAADAERLASWIEASAPDTDIRSASTPPRGEVAGGRVIVHLSDIHFGKRERDGKQVDMHRFVAGDYGTSLSAVLSEKLAHLKGKNPVVVVSGDLTYRGTVDEFDQVRAFLDELCAGLELQKERVVLVPGNHDIHWPTAKDMLHQRFDNYLTFLERFYGESLLRRLYPKLNWTFRVHDQRDEPHQLVGLTVVDDVAYFAINSCTYETDQHHYGFVGGPQLATIDGLMNAVPSDVIARVAVLHHHLHPFPEKLDERRTSDEVWMDLSTIRDAGLVERRLEKLNFDLVLHGHKHRAQMRETLVRDRNERLMNANRLIVCGAGSTGVNGLELGGAHTHFETIEILGPRRRDADFLCVEWHELPLVPDSDWLTSQRWTITG